MDYPQTSTGAGLDREVRQLRSLDDLLPDVVYALPRCDEEVTIRKTLAETAQMFCRETGCFTYEKVITLTDTGTRYALATPWTSDVLMVNSAKVYTVDAAEVETLDYQLHERQFYVEDPADSETAYVNLYAPIKAATGTTKKLKIELSLIPAFDEMSGTQACAFPEKWLRRWRGAVVNGTIARLAGMARRPWSNETLANDAGKRYSYLKGEAVSKVGISRMQRGSATCIDDLQWC